MLGVILTAVLSIICTKEFKIHGAVMQFSESLLYSGYQDLNLTKIFMSAISIGGSSIALLMTFMAQGTPIYNILNYKRIASEIIDTVVGSFGLATTAPFTALLAGLILPLKKNNRSI